MMFIPAVRPALPATESAWCFAFADGQLLLTGDTEIGLAPRPWRVVEPLASERHYLGQIDGLDAWTFRIDAVPDGWRALPLRAAMMQFGEPLMGVAARAAQILEWDRAHRFCGVCATPTVVQANERSRICPACGHVVYPRISPAMMALVWRGQELLLARSARFAPGMYSALAGFVEAGESLEDCVRREVQEEVGVRVGALRYFGSQSWPFPHSLMVAYTAEWVDGEIVPQPDEIESAGWFSIDELPGIPPRFSIAGHLIRDTVQALRGA